MKVAHSAANTCRWTEISLKEYLDWTIIEDESIYGLTGNVNLICLSPDGKEMAHIKYDYGYDVHTDKFESMNNYLLEDEFKKFTVRLETPVFKERKWH